MKRKTVRTVLALLSLALLVTAPRAQQPAPATAKQSPEDRVALYQALLDLTNPWTVMCIAAHPDDEDGTSLIVMRRKYGAHTISLFSTFGEGGQNAIGPELYEELGAIRARETMAAAEVQGSEAYFLGLKDFGYTKSADETFKIWGHEEALRRMVLQIRKLRPDVIITNHSVTNNDHGQHQATARLTLEAFDAAADPKRFPEQLKDGVTAWQVQRLFVRAPRSAAQSTGQKPDREGGRNDSVTIDPNERDPIRETVYAEEALRGLQKHATQGPWPKTFAEFAARFRSFTGQSAAPGQLPPIRYLLTREAKGANTLTKESHNFLDGLRLPEEVAKQLKPPTINGKPLTEFVDQRRQLVDALVGIRKSGKFRPEKPNETLRFERMDQRLDAAFAAVTKITAKTTPRDAVVTPGLRTAFTVTISNNGSLPTSVYSTTFFAGQRNVKTLHSGSAPFPPGDTGSVTDGWTIPPETVSSLPHAQHLYDGRVFGDDFKEVVTINLADIQFSVTGSTRVDVVPAVEVTNISLSPAVRTPPDRKTKLRGIMDCTLRDFDYKVRLTNHLDAPFSGRLIVGPGFGRRAAYHPITIAAHDTADLTVSVPGCPQQTDPKTASDQKAEPISFTVIGNGTTKPLARLEVPIIFADARVAPNLRVGYIRGFDFSLPNALTALGVESKELTVDEVKAADLQKYSAVIVDNRVYESTPGLIEANQKLLDYAKNGGTLIVFYHKSFEWNPDERRKRPQLAPYKLILGDERITDENAPITFLEPQHPLLNFPNKMGQEDFANWIQERGLYYPKEWDPQFHALLQLNDPGEAPLKGGLLVADYGGGRYIYSSMVWYRELRVGVPRAYRMLANMISYGAKK